MKLKIKKSNFKANNMALYFFALYSLVCTQLYSMFGVPSVVESLFLTLLLLMIFWSLIKKNMKLSVNFLWILPIIVLGFNLFRVSNINTFGKIIIVWLISYLLICGTLTKVDDFDSVTKMFSVGAIIYAVSIIFQCIVGELYFDIIEVFFLDEYVDTIINLWNTRGTPTGLTHQAGFTAGYVAVGLGLIFFLEKNIHKKNVLTIVMIVALFLIKKRAHFAFAIISMFIVYFLCFPPKKRFFKFVQASLFVLGFLIIAIMFVQTTGISTVFDDYLSTIQMFLSGEDFTSSRTILTLEALSFWAENKIFGIGWGGYSLRSAATGYMTHNVFVQLLCETGIVGLVCFIIPMIYSLVRTMYAIVQYRTKSDLKMYKLLLSSGYYQIFFLCYCVTGNPLYDNSFLIPYLIFVALSALCIRLLKKQVGAEIV